MMASVGSMILGSSRSSTLTSPGAYRTAPRMVACSFQRAMSRSVAAVAVELTMGST
jgi:hypothetical protein